jgi:type II secretory pathway pseudopilin PulG
MPTRLYLRVAAILIAVILATILVATWRANRRDAAQLAADLAAAKQSLAQAEARQHDRDKQLLQTLAALAAQKRNITTPAQIVRDLPKQIPLPTPVTLQDLNAAENQSNATCSSDPVCGPEGLELTQPRGKATGNSAPTQAILPIEDLKPLYDFAIDCKAKLAVAQADLTDERAKTAVLTHERDQAVHAAKGGSVLRRITRNAKWLAIGALAGAVAAKAHR